jgi:hypothetical protein
MTSIATDLHRKLSFGGVRKKFSASPSIFLGLVITISPMTQTLQLPPVRILRYRIPVVRVMNRVKHFSTHEE